MVIEFIKNKLAGLDRKSKSSASLLCECMQYPSIHASLFLTSRMVLVCFNSPSSIHLINASSTQPPFPTYLVDESVSVRPVVR